MSIRAVIVDDEKKLLEVIKMKLEVLCPQVEIVGTALTVDQAYDTIRKEKPDLIFLDIALKEQTGFDLLEMFEEVFFEVIFVTSYDEYAIRAFKKSAVDYLLKPLDSKELVIAVNKAAAHLATKNKAKRYETLQDNLDPTVQKAKTIVIPHQNSYVFLKESQIIRCEGWQKYTRLITTDHDVITSSRSIGYYIEILDDNLFFHSHRSHIINIDFIESYTSDGNIVLKNKDNVPVARNKRKEFKERFLP